MCNDPTRQVITVLFTNRCYPNQTKGLDTIHYVRQNFNNAVRSRVFVTCCRAQPHGHLGTVAVRFSTRCVHPVHARRVTFKGAMIAYLWL